MKGELKALNPRNQKRKWNDRGTSSVSAVQTKPAIDPNKFRPAASKEPCAKCGPTNHTTAECRIGTNKSM